MRDEIRAESDELISAGGNSFAFLALLEKLSNERAWAQDAACLGEAPDGPDDEDPFFPPFGSQGAKAQAICAGCPVREKCQEESEDELYGVWGGLSVEERRRRRKIRDGRA